MKKNKKNKVKKNKNRKPGAGLKPLQSPGEQELARDAGMDLVTALKTALEHQQAGQLDLAGKFFQKALEIDPDNSIAHQLLGRLAHLRGAHQEAVDFFVRAIECGSDNAEIRTNLGSCLSEIKQYAEAVQHLEKALEFEPDHAMAHNNLGVALTYLDKPDAALDHINRSLAIRPDNAAAYNNLGTALREGGQFDQALEAYNRALELQPEFSNAHYNRAIVFEHLQLFDDAIGAYQKALEINPDFAEAHFNLGNIYMESGSISNARKHNDKALELNSAYVHAHSGEGTSPESANTNLKLGKSWLSGSAPSPEVLETSSRQNDAIKNNKHFDEAITRYRQAISAKPDFADAHNNLGIVLSDAGQLEEALVSFDRAISLVPEFASAHANLGGALQQSGKLEEAIAACRKALELDENLADAHMNLAVLSFMTGDLATGWEEYEWRSKIKRLVSPKRSFTQPQWDGSSLDGKKILLWGDQGLGDEIRYASLIPDMLDKGAEVSIECAPRLVDLFARSFPQASVHAYPFDSGESGRTNFDFQIPVAGLGRFARPSVETFSGQREAYLVPDFGRLEFWKKRFSEVSPRPKIGINWRSQDTSERWKHYYATIDDLAPIMSIPGVDFVNLMYDADADELAEFERLYGVTLLGWDDINLKNDLDELAALNAGLDLVVSCLSSVTEMSGALGVPTFGFIGDRKDPVMLGTGNAIWHPNSTYFSKDRGGSWQPVLEDIAQEIRKKFLL